MTSPKANPTGGPDTLATVQLERDAAREDARRANVRSNALTAAVAGGVVDPHMCGRVQDQVEAERERAKRERQPFDLDGACRRAVHADKGCNGIAPVPARGAAVHPGGGTAPRTFEDVAKERAKYRERLRELGLIDPATQSVPGDGGGLTGGGGR